MGDSTFPKYISLFFFFCAVNKRDACSQSSPIFIAVESQDQAFFYAPLVVEKETTKILPEFFFSLGAAPPFLRRTIGGSSNKEAQERDK